MISATNHIQQQQGFNPSSPQTIEAASRMQRCWRRHREHFDTISHDTIVKMPHRLFKRYVACRLHRIQQHPQPTALRSLAQLVAERAFDRSSLPTITDCGQLQGDIQLPSYTYAKSNRVTTSEFTYLAFTPQARREQMQLQKRPITKQELDALFKALANTDLIPWELMEDRAGNCSARANLALELLSFMGVHQDCLYKQYAIIPCSHFVSPMLWTNYYHVAPLVVLSDRTAWVIDPAINRNKALTVDEWYQQLKQRIKISDQIDKRVSADRFDQSYVTNKIRQHYEHFKSLELQMTRPTMFDALIQTKPEHNLFYCTEWYSFSTFLREGAEELYAELSSDRKFVERSWITHDS